MISLASAAVGRIWKLAAIALLSILLAGGASLTTAWRLAAGARDQALAGLQAEQIISAALRNSIAEQNRAVDGMARATLAAQERGAAAQAQAATRSQRYDAALAQISGARATTCDEAMPAVNALLQSIGPQKDLSAP